MRPRGRPSLGSVRVRALARRAAGLLALIVLLFGMVRSGARYFHCPAMGAVLTASCCGERDRGGDDDGAPVVDAPDCCEGRRLGTLPGAATSPGLEVLGAPLSAILPPFSLSPASIERAPAVRITHAARAGPKTARERRAVLMVWTS